MTFTDDLEPGITGPERDALLRMSDRLAASRPVPSAVFRGELRRSLTRRHRPPPALRLRIAGALATGTLLLGTGTLGVGGIGPLSPRPLPPALQAAAPSLSR